MKLQPIRSREWVPGVGPGNREADREKYVLPKKLRMLDRSRTTGLKIEPFITQALGKRPEIELRSLKMKTVSEPVLGQFKDPILDRFTIS